MIRKIGAERYPELIRFAEENRCGKVYPLSIAQKTQAGDVFADSEGDFRSVLFWHCSGFAFLAGEAQEAFLDDVFALLTDQSRRNPRRFVLLTDDRQAEQFLFSKGGVDRQRRALFAYGQKPPPAASLPVGYEWREMDGELSARIQGRVVPALFWQRPEDFLERGKGFCIVRGGDIAAWAFSAAVSGRQIDIGVETHPAHQRLGLAAAAAGKMVQYALEQGKEPVWACHCANLASGKLAEKLGFSKVSECSVLKKI